MRTLLTSSFVVVWLTTCPYASHSPHPPLDPLEGPHLHGRNNETVGFMGDTSRFGRGGGTSASSSSPWTFSSTAARSRIVETKYGRVQGLSVTLFSNLHYSGNRNFPLKNKIVEIYMSIPYAAPPIKSHRFSPTQTPVPWNDVKATIQPSPIFPDIRNESAALREMPKGYLEYLRRVEPYLRNQSEDCLYLNIFSPIGPDAKLKPVLVYIHGGMFAWGSGNLVDGTVMAAYSDVVFVSINYRLSILGFLNLNDSPSSKPRVANYGLMDQIAALHWIKENIRNFGGDPDSVTLMGYEAGAACINFLMSSPTVTPGLFHRSILIAGSSHSPWALIQEPYLAGQSVAAALNCSLNSPPPMGKREVGKKYDILVGLSSLEKLTEFSEFSLFHFLPPPFASRKQMDLEFGFESHRRDAILRTLVRNSYRYHRNEILATITNEYIDWERTAQHPISTRDMAVNAVTDCVALAPVVAVTDSSLVKKAFFYVFEHSTKDGLYNYHRAGAGGGEELNYIFGNPLIEFATGGVLPFLPSPLPSNYSKGEVALSELWMSFISNFGRTGNPNGPIKIDSISSWPVSKERNRYKNTVWELYDRLHQKYLEIGANKIRTRSHYRAHQMAIWLRLVPELQRSGAQMASSFHNKMKGGNDPVLYMGRLKQPEEDGEQEPPGQDVGVVGGGLNSAMLYDLLLGYGYGVEGGVSPGVDGVTLLGGEDGQSETGIETDLGGAKGGKSPTLTLTTCYSPVSSSVQSGGRGTNETGTATNFFDGSNFPPYSVILAITIAVGCSLLILNILIFALVICQRGRRRRKSRLLLKSSSNLGVASSASTTRDEGENRGDDENDSHHLRHGSTSTKFSYSEPPELLKSNRTTASSFLQNSQSSHLQAEIEALEVLELTVKQHHQELLGEKALLTMDNLASHETTHPANYTTHTLPRNYFHHQHQQTSSPSVASSQLSSTSSTTVMSTTAMTPLAIATLPRCNGGLTSFLGGGGGSSTSSSVTNTTKPYPPPRGGCSATPSGGGTLRRGVRIDYSDTYNSDSNNENEAELKV
ncbi:Neuroligin-4, X-linked [Folsomia candida]|uniref:Neuroligin-4, X-linked n=1 Tax=Folsomia candida TaxID=158441 RepID=A0A226DPN6_FOLCA|nr:Neuroligin-4, X-linked [Folsomia candida]